MQGLPLLAARWHVWWPPNLATYIHHDTATQTTATYGSDTRSTHTPQAIAADFSSPRPTLAASWVGVVSKLSSNLVRCRPVPCPRSDAMHRRMTAAGVVLLCTLFPTPANCAAAALDTSSKLHAVRFQRFLQLHPGLRACILAAPALLERSWKAGLLP